MIYDVRTRELSSDDGKLLKKLDCPLHKQWSNLTVIQETESERHCASCQKRVVSLVGMSDEDTEALVTRCPDCCVYIPRSSPNVKVTGRGHGKQDDPCPFRRIHTARGQKDINQAVSDGFWPLVKQVKRSPKIRSWMAVYQHGETGEIQCVGDYRVRLGLPWKQIIKPFDFYLDTFADEIAAYLIPSDLKSGERVFLTDLIEDRVGVFGNQRHTYRLTSAYAIWDGKDFKVQWVDVKDAERWIG